VTKNWTCDLDDGRVTWEGGAIDLTPHEAAIFGLADKAYPHKVSRRALLAAAYPSEMLDADLPDDAWGSIRSTKSQLRRKLLEAGAPFDLTEIDSFGYRLEVKP
jgi:DNA-binding response OmpR family regulator